MSNPATTFLCRDPVWRPSCLGVVSSLSDMHYVVKSIYSLVALIKVGMPGITYFLGGGGRKTQWKIVIRQLLGLTAIFLKNKI